MSSTKIIEHGKLIDKKKHDTFVQNYESSRQNDELKHEDFSIGVLDLLNDPEGKYLRVILGRDENQMRIILACVNENGKVVRKLIDSKEFEVGRVHSTHPGTEELLLIEMGRPCPKQCGKDTNF